MSNPFRYFNSSPEIIRLTVLMYVKYLPSLRNAEDLLAERGIDVSHETVWFWWNRFGPMFAAEIRKRRAAHMRDFSQCLSSGASIMTSQSTMSATPKRGTS
jgi:putative transposase